jgi:rare lipoprotein A
VEANLPWTVVESSANGTKMSGIASWYGGYWHGRKTANGERYDQNSLTAAHRTLPFNTLVKVTNQRNGRSVVVRINNRGPHIRGRVLDLSVAAAKQIVSHSGGLAPVEGVVIGRAVR